MRKAMGGAALLTVLAIMSVVLGIGVGSVYLSPKEIAAALAGRGDEGVRALILGLRLPRVVLAFLTGAALAVGGTVMQSSLENPLASPYGLGVSAGAGLGATLVMVTGIAGGTAGMICLPVAGFAGGLGAVLLALALAKTFDARLSSITVVLTGMVISLFFSAFMDLMAAMSPEYAQRISLWQMGSFAAKGWRGAAVLGPVFCICLCLFLRRSSMLDVMTFGDEQAQVMGVDTQKSKWGCILLVAVLTGTAVAFSGIIGFVDLVAPHIARRLFGAGHRRALPGAAVLGGSFMVLCDLAARTVASPREIPVGAVTALLGAPFFLYVFFRKRRQ